MGQIDGADVAGITSLMAEAPTRPAWNTYVAVASADEAPERRGVTFAVDDADATAKTAASLGATVVVPPFDAPGCA